MTINSNIRTAGPFAGTGALIAYPFAFKVFVATDILAAITNTATGAITPWALTTNYTIALNADQDANPGGTLTPTVALASGFTLNLTSAVPQTQGVDITNSGGFLPSLINNALDRQTILVQQLQTTVSLGMQFPLGELSTVVTALPSAIVRANKFLVFDASGNPTASASSYTDFTTTAANISSIITVASNISSVTAVAANTTNVNLVAGAITNVNLVAGSIANVNTVATNLTNINAVAGAIANINTVASNITAINTNATNIVAIQGASANALAAASSATSAAASAAVASGSLMGTSTTSNTVGTGAKTFTTQTGLAIPASGGNFVVVANTAAPANYMHGQVTSYNTGTGQLVVNVLDVGGTGTLASWNIVPSSPQGPAGAGTGTVNSGTANQLLYYAATGTTASGNANATIVNGALTLGVAGTAAGSLVLSGSTSGTTTLVVAAAASGSLTLPSATDTLICKATVDTLTNKTYDTAGTGNVFKIAGTQITSISGNTGKVVTTTGTLTATHVAVFDASGNLIDGGATLPAAGVVSVKRQIITSSGTYTPSTGMLYADVEVQGGGAGGGGVAGVAGGAGAGGGAGAYSRSLISAATIGASQTATIGAAGGNNASGGASSLGALVTAPGGSRSNAGSNISSSTFFTPGGLGGTAGTGDYTRQGDCGSPGLSVNSTLAVGGNGASSRFGAGGQGSGGGAGTAALGFGAGGGGAYSTGSIVAGGVGKAGVIIITEYCSV